MNLFLRILALVFLLLSVSCGKSEQDPSAKIKAASTAAAEKAFRENRVGVISEIKDLIAQGKLDPAIYRIDRLQSFNDAELAKLRADASSKLAQAKRREAEAAAKEAADTLRRGNAFLKSARKQRDDIEKTTWYYDPSSPRYQNQNAFYLYIGKNDTGDSWMRLRIQYAASNWLFVESVTIVADDFRYDSGAVRFERGNRDTIWEWYDGPFRETELVLIDRIIHSKKAVIRFVGRQYHMDRIITAAEKQALRNTLDGYNALLAAKKSRP